MEGESGVDGDDIGVDYGHRGYGRSVRLVRD